VILKPPFVILPIVGAAGLLIALGYWILTAVRRPREAVLKSVAVSHLATRPDYTTGFGVPTPEPAAPAAPPSAWPEEPAPSAWPAATADEAAPAGDAPVDDGASAPAPDKPPDLPESSDY
jgi:hypothetical protein